MSGLRIDRASLSSKFPGAFIGTAVGDALGAPFEGYPRVDRQEIEAVAERLPVLTYTDDTHMMLGVAESLLRCRGFDGEDMARTFVQNYEREPYRGYGPGPILARRPFPADGRRGWKTAATSRNWPRVCATCRKIIY